MTRCAHTEKVEYKDSIGRMQCMKEEGHPSDSHALSAEEYVAWALGTIKTVRMDEVVSE